MPNISGAAYLILKWLYDTPNSLVVSYHRLEKYFIGYRTSYSFDTGPNLKTVFPINSEFISELIDRNLIDVSFCLCSDGNNDKDDYSAFQINCSGISFLREVSPDGNV